MFEYMKANIDVVFLIVALISIVFVIIFKRSKSKARKENVEIRDVESLNEFLRPYGYAYDPHQDIFYSIIDAWQRNMGYTRIYDEAAGPSSMILDCEPIYFEYDNKRWMIEFWKGQCGMTTSFEIGVYYTDELNLTNEYINWIFYDCVDDENLLKMKFALIKNGKTIMKRKGTHWWLTGFKLGEFSQPWELVGKASIELKDLEMRNAFIKGLQRAGYRREEILVKGKIVGLTFDKPKTLQPFTRIDEFDEVTQKKNKLLCDSFNELTKDYDNSLDKLIALQEIAPDMLKRIVLMGKPKDIFN